MFSNINLSSEVGCKLKYPSSALQYISSDNEALAVLQVDGLVNCIFTDIDRIRTLHFKLNDPSRSFAEPLKIADAKAEAGIAVDVVDGFVKYQASNA